MSKLRRPVGQAAGFLDEQVGGLGAAVGHAVGVEVSEHLLTPLAQSAAEARDFGDRTGREGGDDLLRDPAAGAARGRVGLPQLLVALLGDGEPGSPSCRQVLSLMTCRSVRFSAPWRSSPRIL